MRTLLPILFLVFAGLSGCGEEPQFARVDFPKTPGNYVQFYSGFFGTVVELGKVDQAGKVISISTSKWDAKPNRERSVTNATAYFKECGIVAFTEHKDGQVSGSFGAYAPAKECPLTPFPAQWTRIVPDRQ